MLRIIRNSFQIDHNNMLILLFTIAYSYSCEYENQEINDIPVNCTKITIDQSNLTCLGEELIINTTIFRISKSIIKNCNNFLIYSDSIAIASLTLANQEKQNYIFNSSVIWIQNYLSGVKAQLHLESENNIEISNGLIETQAITMKSKFGNIILENSTIFSQDPQCNMRNTTYTNLLIDAAQNFSLNSDSKIQASTSKIISNNSIIEGIIDSPFDCYTNEGKGKAPKFTIETENCAFGGGSSAGFGGSGSAEFVCQELERTAKQFIHSKPYNNKDYFKSGSGGAGTQFLGSGGGIIVIESLNTLTLNGYLSANGKNGNYINSTSSQGGGGGGVLFIKAQQIEGKGQLSAKGGSSDVSGIVGEGGGGLVVILGIMSKESNLTINVDSGFRKNPQAQKGSIFLLPCPDGYYLNNLICEQCPTGSTFFARRGQCFRCPGVPDSFVTWPKCDETLCSEFYCDPIKFISEISGTLLNLLLMITIVVFVLIGYAIRRMYRTKEIKYEKLPFDFESATRYMTLDHLLTDELLKNTNFQLIDLMYHVHRITLLGNNSAEFPWRLPYSPDAGIGYLMDIEEYRRFAQRINKIAEWPRKEKIVLMFLSIVYYPLYWVYYTSRKKKKYLKIVEFFNQSQIMKVVDEQFIKIKLSKSADYTLLYLDIFNYRISDLRYFFLACPYYILLSGEGTFLRPLYLCESNPFLSCLYFSINRKKEIHEERNKILDNLVAHKKRMENSQQLNKFIIKFNRYARAIDRDSDEMLSDVKQLIIFCQSWNQKFFSNFQITINIIMIIGEEFTILENCESPKFKQFIIDNKEKNMRYGLFIYDSEADPEEIEDVLDNRISLEESGQLQVMEEENEELPMEELKHKYIERIQDASVESISLMEAEAVRLEKSESKKNAFLGRIRYWLLSHKVPSVGSNAKIYLQLILTFFDALFLTLLIQQSIQSIQFLPQQILFLCFPYPLSVVLSPILGCLWMTTQSYGIAKAHAIFGVLSVFNLLTFLLLMIQELSLLSMAILICDIIVKGLIVYNTKRVLSLNIKLNKLNQIKHIIQ